MLDPYIGLDRGGWMSRPVFKIFFSLFFIVLGKKAYSQVISSNSTEVLFSYSTEFTTSNLIEPWGDAYAHHIYLFGVMHSPELTASLGVDSSLIEGIGSPRSDVDITVENVEEAEDGGYLIKYKIKGRMLLHITRLQVTPLQMAFLHFRCHLMSTAFT